MFDSVLTKHVSHNNYLKFHYTYNSYRLPVISDTIKLFKSYDIKGDLDLCTANHADYDILITSHLRRGIPFDDLLSELNKGIHKFNGDVVCDRDNSMVVMVHTENERKEYMCDAVRIGNSITLRKNLHCLRVETFKSFVHGDYIPSEVIELDDTLIGLELLAYKKPHQLPISLTTNDVQMNYPSIKPYVKPYDGSHLHGYGMRVFPITLLMEVNWGKRQIFCSSCKTVNYYEYTTISHASMDPEPDEHCEQTTWEIKALIQFYSLEDVKKYISKCNATEENNWLKKPDISFYKTKEYASTTETERDLGIKLLERWY